MRVAIVVSKKSKEGLEKAKKIAEIVKNFNHTVDNSMIKRSREEEMKDFSKTFKTNMNSVKNADVIIAESTEYSAGLGFLVAKAIDERKNILCLQSIDAHKKGSATLQGATSKSLTYLKYNEENLEDLLKNYLDEVKNKLDTKFILIISPDIDKYLKWAGDEYRLHKAQIVREAVEDKMKKDKRYKDYLKQIE